MPSEAQARITINQQLEAAGWRFLRDDQDAGTPACFDVLVLDGELRGFIERGEFAQIRSLDAGLYQAIKTVGAEELKSLRAYVEAHVAKDDFVRVA